MSNVLNIDLDKECSHCHELGASKVHGLCLACSYAFLVGNSEYEPKGNDKRRLPVNLTADEVKAYGEELATTIIAKGKLEAERAVLNKKIKPLVERLDELAPIVDSGIEERDIECRWYYQWETGERYLVRHDTREVVEVDTIQEWERQQRMKFAHQPEKGAA